MRDEKGLDQGVGVCVLVWVYSSTFLPSPIFPQSTAHLIGAPPLLLCCVLVSSVTYLTELDSSAPPPPPRPPPPPPPPPPRVPPPTVLFVCIHPFYLSYGTNGVGSEAEGDLVRNHISAATPSEVNICKVGVRQRGHDRGGAKHNDNGVARDDDRRDKVIRFSYKFSHCSFIFFPRLCFPSRPPPAERDACRDGWNEA